MRAARIPRVLTVGVSKDLTLGRVFSHPLAQPLKPSEREAFAAALPTEAWTTVALRPYYRGRYLTGVTLADARLLRERLGEHIFEAAHRAELLELLKNRQLTPLWQDARAREVVSDAEAAELLGL